MKITADKFLLPFKKIIEGTGANYVQVCHIVDLKLMIDNRKARQNQGNNKTPTNTLLKQGLTYVLLGAILSANIFVTKNLFFTSFSTHIILMVMLTVTMLTEYSISLFDTRDNQLIIPLPMNSQTMGWSRVMHILIYLFFIAMSLLLPSIVFTGIKFGVLPMLLLWVSGLLDAFFVLFFTIFVYLGLMKFTNGEKLKDIMMYIQVGFTILMMVGYQFIPRNIIPQNGTEAIDLLTYNYLFVPPAWFAMLSCWSTSTNMLITIGAVMAIVLPIAGMFFIGKRLFYGFESNLKALDSTNAKKEKSEEQKSKNILSIWGKVVAFILGVPRRDKALFDLMWKLTGRERMFKQAILPLVAYMVVFPIASFFTKNNFGEGNTRYIIFLYFSLMTSSSIPGTIWIGNNAFSTSLFRSLPSVSPGQVIQNAVKAAIGRYFIPVFLLLSVPLFYFKGVSAISDVICVFVFNLFICYILLHIQQPYLPFTQSKSVAQGGKTAIKMMLIMLVAFPVGFLHVYLIGINGWLSIIPGLVLLPFVVLLDKKWTPEKMSWKMIERANKA